MRVCKIPDRVHVDVQTFTRKPQSLYSINPLFIRRTHGDRIKHWNSGAKSGGQGSHLFYAGFVSVDNWAQASRLTQKLPHCTSAAMEGPLPPFSIPQSQNWIQSLDLWMQDLYLVLG